MYLTGEGGVHTCIRRCISQARFVIERSGEWLCVGAVEKNQTCTYGQLPHHFAGTTPTFLALSGATQTGPNTFWVGGWLGLCQCLCPYLCWIV